MEVKDIVEKVSALNVEKCNLILLRLKRVGSRQAIENLKDSWLEAVKGTELQKIRVVVVDALTDVEFYYVEGYEIKERKQDVSSSDVGRNPTNVLQRESNHDVRQD